MESPMVALSGALGTMAFFAFLAFVVWIDYRKKKDEREAAHEERLKALELGFPPLDAEIERAKAYTSAAWAAGLIGLLVPIALVLVTAVGTLVVLLTLDREGLFVPLIVVWSITGVLVLVAVVRSLNVIRHLPRPSGETPPRAINLEKPNGGSSERFQEKRPEL
jgi:hypothetical protein